MTGNERTKRILDVDDHNVSHAPVKAVIMAAVALILTASFVSLLIGPLLVHAHVYITPARLGFLPIFKAQLA